jgi:2-dehydro-3-deoxygluconokinase
MPVLPALPVLPVLPVLPTLPVLVCIGETMAMVAPHGGGRLAEGSHFRVDAGGAESNVAAHVAALGHRAAWFSRLGADSLGTRVASQLAQRGVDVSSVVFDPSHATGVYFKDPGHGVLYYRAQSAASFLAPADANAVSLEGVTVVHVSGITAALSESAAAFLDVMIDRAHNAGVLVSFDVNYRAALWHPEVAADPLAALARRADIVFTGRDEAEHLWGTADAAAIRRMFAQVHELVIKDGSIGATTFCGAEQIFEPSLTVDVVDVVGAGDAFAGGYLAAFLTGAPITDRLVAGHARAALTLQTTGDSVGQP